MKNQRFRLIVSFHLLGWLFLARSLMAFDEKKYRIVVLDKDQHSVVPDASLIIFDQNQHSVKVTQALGEFIVTLPDEGTFTINVSADEYLPIKGKVLVRDGARIIQVLMTRRAAQAPTQTVAFIARDALSKQPMGATFKINSTQIKDLTPPTVTTAAHPEFGTELRMNHRYLLKVSAADYQEYTASIMIDVKEPEPVVPRTIYLQPLLYSVKFTVREGAGMQNLLPARFQIWASGNEVPVKLEGADAHAILRVGTTYDFRVEAEGYEPFERTLKLGMPTEPRDLHKTVLMIARSVTNSGGVVASPPDREIRASEAEEYSFENLKVGETVQLKNVYFDQSSYILRSESFAQLDKLVSTLQKYPKIKIEIGGHTDNVGDERLNLLLSENRAKVIATYLENKGISEKRLLWKGYGQAQPIAPNDSEENKAKNRRVEFIVLEN